MQQKKHKLIDITGGKEAKQLRIKENLINLVDQYCKENNKDKTQYVEQALINQLIRDNYIEIEIG